jgi:DNA mismatch repair ATPase MutL
MIGSRGFTTKSFTSRDLRYGYRGSALFSLKHIANIKILSWLAGSDSATEYSFDEDGKVKLKKLKNHNRLIYQTSGTSVSLTNIFDRYTVRYKNISNRTEISRIKEFIRKMAVLYHNISWKFIDNTRHSHLKATLEIVSCASVLERLASTVQMAHQFNLVVGYEGSLKLTVLIDIF